MEVSLNRGRVHCAVQATVTFFNHSDFMSFHFTEKYLIVFLLFELGKCIQAVAR